MPPINVFSFQQRQPLASPYAQDFANQLGQLQSNAPSQLRTGGALASNLLADALLQYGANRQRAAANAANTPSVANVGHDIPTVSAPPPSSMVPRPTLGWGDSNAS